MTHPIDRLLAATRDAVRHATRTAADCPEIGTLDRLLSRPLTRSPIEPARQQVVSDWLDTAVQALGPGPERTLADALAAASPALQWTTPYATDADAGDLAMSYAVAMLAGPFPPVREGYLIPFVSREVLVAFTVQGPGRLYPLHRHKAPEIYHVISGAAEWKRDGESWRRRLPGEWLFHSSEQGHAMRTGDEPLLAMAAWTDHLNAPPPGLEIEEEP